MPAPQFEKVNQNRHYVYTDCLFQGIPGRLVALERQCFFETSSGTKLLEIDFQNIMDVSIHKNSEKMADILITTTDNTFTFNADDEEVNIDEVFVQLKSHGAIKRELDSFIRKKVSLSYPGQEKFFSPSTIARYQLAPDFLSPGEKIEAVLSGHYCPNFSKQQQGLLTLTGERILFLTDHGIQRSIDLTELQSWDISVSLDDMKDKKKKKHTYNITLNHSDFAVSVRTGQIFKMDLFQKILARPHKKNDSH